MSTGADILRLSAVAASIAFAAGLCWAAVLRFGTGEIYPPYSSYREDPVGAKGLLESVDGLPGRIADRNVLPLSRLKSGNDTTLLVIGIAAQTWNPGATGGGPEAPARNAALRKFLSSGGRLVLALRSDNNHFNPCASLIDGPVPALVEQTFPNGAAATGPLGELPWHGTCCLDLPGDDWNTVAAVDGNPVIVERRTGEGSVVIATDSYLLSNEGLREDRRPAFPAWLLADNTRIIFDESHRGTIRNTNIATLARRRNLEWLFFAIVVLAALFIWKSVFSFIPRSREDIRRLAGGEVRPGAGRDGLAVLVGRNGRGGTDLLETCLDEYRRSKGAVSRTDLEKLKKMNAEIAAANNRPRSQRDSAATYGRMCTIANERKRNA